MILIVEGIEEIVMERMDVLHAREAVQNQGDLLREGFLCKLDLSGIEVYRSQSLSRARGSFCLVLLIREI